MNQTTYRGSRPVRSPYQPARSVQKKEQEHPILAALNKLCGTRYLLSVSYSPDTTLMSEVKTEGLVGVRCELKLGERLIGVGHASTVLDPRINRATTRSLLGCLNGSLASAIHSGCKTLDIIRLDAADEQGATERSAMRSEVYPSGENPSDGPATEKQKQYLLQLASVNLDEDEREQFAASIDDMTRQEASRAISEFAR
jgi:hypothetical protein